MNRTVRNRFSPKTALSLALAKGRGIRIETNLDPYLKQNESIHAFDFSRHSDSGLREAARAIAQRLGSGEPREKLLPEAFALVREAAIRTLGLVPYDVQLIAGAVLAQGKLAQMKTGEGKTLAIVFAAATEVWSGRSVHVMTANDYLARRDAAWMGGLYELLGIEACAVSERMSPDERRDAYRADVTYLTAKQCGFDYLTDGLRYPGAARIRRNFESLIVDEADFIMIDEARVPLVIASRDDTGRPDPYKADAAAARLLPGADFTLDRRGLDCNLTLAGQHKVRRLLGCGGMHEEESREQYAAVHAALHARHLLRRDVDYIVRDGKIEQVDAFTGRIADRRRWPYGVQTALEAKEGLEIGSEGRILGSITIQDLVNLYPRKAALTATAVPAADELGRVYGLTTVIVPPNRPDRTVSAPDRLFTTERYKREAIVQEVIAAHRAGRPVLVGTASVEESESYAAELRASGVKCSVLNAKNDDEEAPLIAQAGMPGAVTISTNMAGRGTDIRLGGEDGRERERAVAAGGLYVIGTTRHESVRIDDQLRGRAGRQGDPGLTQCFVSLEDELVRKFAILEFIPRRYLEDTEGAEIRDPRAAREIVRAQEIIENRHAAMRRTLRNYTALTERQRQVLRTLREEALEDRLFPDELLEPCESRITELEPRFTIDPLRELLTRVFLSELDAFWADHLATIDELREGIHLQRLGKRDPLLVFIREADSAFEQGLSRAFGRAADRFLSLLPEHDGDGLPDLGDTGLTGPASVWTYLVSDNPFPGFMLSGGIAAEVSQGLLAAVRVTASLPVLALRAVFRVLRAVFTRNGPRRP